VTAAKFLKELRMMWGMAGLVTYPLAREIQARLVMEVWNLLRMSALEISRISGWKT
jgi:hypothetical protein